MSQFFKRLNQPTETIARSRRAVAIGSVLFVIVIGFAFLLVYQDAELMREQINDNFNEQQLILARQVASQIEALLHDVTLEVESLARRSVSSDSNRHAADMQAALARISVKGAIGIGFMERTVALWSSMAIKEP
jgi:hypothetical protein